jgi:serine phosphatase RsbU (regulator of sigma subunit)
LLKADGSTHEVGCPERAIGVFDDADLSESEVLLGPGDTLVLYTDGEVEARSPDGAFFGEDRLASFLRSCAGLAAQSTVDCIEAAVLEFQENSPRDDVTALALRVPLVDSSF